MCMHMHTCTCTCACNMHMAIPAAYFFTGADNTLGERIERYTHTPWSVERYRFGDTAHFVARYRFRILYPIFLFHFRTVRTGTSHRSKPRASRPPHATNRYPASNFFVSSNPRRSDTWTCLLQRAHITWRARTPHSTSLGLAFWCDGAGPHPPTFRPHARDGHPARPTPHDVCELT